MTRIEKANWAKIGKSSRRKGMDAEQEVAKMFRRWFDSCKRMFPRQQQGVKFPDIGCPEMNQKFYVEVKRYARIKPFMIENWKRVLMLDYTKFCKYMGEDYDAVPLLIIREDRGTWKVVALSEDIQGYLWIDCDQSKPWAEISWEELVEAFDEVMQ